MKGTLMIRDLKSGLTLILLLLITGSSNGQEKTDIKGAITQKFLTYCKEIPRQEIFVHTDRETYIAGEEIWFNIYLLDRKTNKPEVDNKIAYIEVLNAENRPVVQKRILLDNGSGPGQISLPDTLSSGTYTLRAYTGWMKNFMPENCYMEELRIYNAFRNKAFRYKLYNDNLLSESSVNKLTEAASGNLLLEVNNLIPETLEITVTTDNRLRSSNNNVFYIFIQTHGNIDHFSSVNALNDKTVINFPKSMLTPGINQITLFDAEGHPLKERLIYTAGKHLQQIALACETTFKTREKISVGLELAEDIVKELKWANLSISVFPAGSDVNKIELSDYMLFGSEFGTKPLTFLKNGSISKRSSSQIDSFLLNLESNWIDWDKILSYKTAKLKYKPETEFHYVSGKLIRKNAQTSDSGKYVYMSIPGKIARFQYSKTDNESEFDMKVRIDDRVKDLVIQPGDPLNIASTRIESSFSEKYLPSVPFYSEENSEELPSDVTKMSSNYQVNKIYGTSSLGPQASLIIAQEAQPKRFYGKPDISLIMDDYIKLPVMDEVFFELIPGATLKKKKAGYEISVYDPVDNKIYNVPPCIMVDGVVIYSPSVIAAIDPELVERIELVKDKYYVGDNLFYGILNVITRSGDFSSVTLPEYATRIQYKVFEPSLNFSAPDYTASDRQASRVPDFRNTLYWNSSVKTDRSGKYVLEFWTSDIKSDYIIDIQGVTSNGKLVSHRSAIHVD